MKYIFTILLLLGTYLITLGQTAIINDKDGYTNVRSKPNTKSKVIYQIKTNQVFWYEEDYTNSDSEWVRVYIPKNNFSVNCSYSNLEGFVHKSRIMPFDNMDIYKGTEFTFKYLMKPFSVQDKIIDYQDNKWISTINGLRYYGSDGEKPKYEIENIEISLNKQQILVPEILMMDIFECNNTFDLYKIGETFFVHQWNSDGAGGYVLVWVITKDGVKQRFISTM